MAESSKFTRIVLKLSGEALAGDDGFEPGELVSTLYNLARSLRGRRGVDSNEIGGRGEGEGAGAGRRKVVERRDYKKIRFRVT